MNFIEGTISRDKGFKFTEKGTHLSIDIPKDKQKMLSGHVGRDIWLGIRPEHIRCEKSRTSRINATVDVVEPMGNEMFVYCTCGASQLVARMSPIDVQAGEKKDFSVDTGHIHFFDTITELVIR